MKEEQHPDYSHHYDIGSVIHSIYDRLHHWAIEGDFSDEDLYPLPYENNATIEEKIVKIQNELLEINIKCRGLEFRFGSPKDIEKLEKRHAALDHHMSHIIAENHLQYISGKGFVSAQ